MPAPRWHVDGGELLQCPDCYCLVPEDDLTVHRQVAHTEEASRVKRVVAESMRRSGGS